MTNNDPPNPNRAPVTTRVNRAGWWLLLPALLWAVSMGIAFAMGWCCR